MKDKLFKNFLILSYGGWISLTIGFLGTLITTRILSPEDFGKSSMFTLAMNVFMMLIIFGHDQSFVRFFYEEKEENRGRLLYNCLKIPIGILIIVLAIIFVFNNKITMFLFQDENRITSLLLAIGIFTQALLRYGTLVIRMRQKSILFSILQIFNTSLNLMFLLLFYLLFGHTYKILIYSSVITLVIMSLITIISQTDYWNFKNYLKGYEVHKHSKTEILKYSYPLVLQSLIFWLFDSFDKFALRNWSTFEELGLYAAAFKIVALLNILQTTFSTFWTPVCFEHFEKSPENKDFFQNITKIVAFSMFLVAILSIYAKGFIVYLLGPDFRAASNIMPFLVFMPIMFTMSETTVIGINFYKKTKWHILIAIISCFVNIVGNWLLVPTYGAIGASISTAFSYIVFFSLRTLISLKYYKVDYGLKRIYFMIILISLYAVYSNGIYKFYLNFIAGIFVLLIMLYLYHKDLIKEYKKYKSYIFAK